MLRIEFVDVESDDYSARSEFVLYYMYYII